MAVVALACSSSDIPIKSNADGADGASLCDDPPDPYMMQQCTPECPEVSHISALSPPASGCPIAQRTCAPNCGTFHQCSLFSYCPNGTVELGVTQLPDCELANYKDAAGNNARICQLVD